MIPYIISLHIVDKIWCYFCFPNFCVDNCYKDLCISKDIIGINKGWDLYHHHHHMFFSNLYMISYLIK